MIDAIVLTNFDVVLIDLFFNETEFTLRDNQLKQRQTAEKACNFIHKHWLCGKISLLLEKMLGFDHALAKKNMMATKRILG